MALNEQEDSTSLRSIFDTASRLRVEIEESYDYQSDVYQDKLRAAVTSYQKCKDLIDQISLFSSNEGLEDVSSSEIRYILVDFYLAELSLKENAQDREAVLKRSRTLYNRFLSLCDTYDLLSKTDKSAFEKGAVLSSPADPATRRNEKIAKYKAEKELKAKIEQLSQNSHNLDETDVRALHLASVSLSVMKALQGLEMIFLELDILSRAPKPSDTPRPPPEQDSRSQGRKNPVDNYSEKLDLNIASSMKGGPLLSSSGKPLRPFTLLDSRERLKAGVFKSGHNLPTMTIDEYLEEERKRGGIIEGGGEKSGIIPEPDEDNYEKADAETMKAREWDEFKEANPRGSGNTLNRG
ncbi:TAP42-like protein [Morchella snyderi]|nr:TAP42-like protein [Morchella snyderi]